MSRSSDCLHCGALRSSNKAGHCRDCMELFLVLDRLEVRRLMTAWRKRAYPDGTSNPIVPEWDAEKQS